MSTHHKTFALAGHFGFQPGPKGITVFRYHPRSAAMEAVETTLEAVNIGHMTVDAERKIIYATDERSNLRGQLGGGGYVLALAIDPASGSLSLVSEKPTFSAKPCFTCLDKTGRYLLVSHHADSGSITRLVRNEAGFSSLTVFDDAALVVFRVNPDGSLGEMCDALTTPGDGPAGAHPISHLHAVIADPTGELFIVPDKGLDRLHSFRLERETGKLIRLADTCVETGTAPRYGAFHPRLPIFYVNFERQAKVHAYRYDVFTGKLELAGAVALLAEEPGAGSPADIVIHPQGKTLYVSMRGANTITVLDVDVEGALALRQILPCGGVNPRGLTIAPDGRFLFAANVESGSVAVFSIGADGTLQPASGGARGGRPGIVRFLEV